MSFVSSAAIIFGMFIVTFGVRFILFARAHKVRMPTYIERALKFVPVAVLTAIITPMIFMPSQYLDISLGNPWLIGSTIAFAIGIWRQHQLLTISIGVLAFFIAQYIFLSPATA